MRWFELESVICQRLKDELIKRGLEHVHVLTSINLLTSPEPPTPAILVVPGDVETKTVRPSLAVQQTWLTVPMVREVAHLSTGWVDRAEVEQLMDVCWVAVPGPVPGAGPLLQRQGGWPKDDYRAGIYYRPMAWACQDINYNHTRDLP